MNTLDSAVKGFDSSVSNFMTRIDKNEYVSSALALFLILYAAVAAPQLPKNIARLFDNVFVKLLMFFLIAYYARKNPTVAIIAAVALMVTLITLNKINVNERIAYMMRRGDTESFSNSAMVTPEHPLLAQNATPMVSNEISMEEASIRSVAHIPEEVLSEMRGQSTGQSTGQVSGEHIGRSNQGGQVPAEVSPEVRGETHNVAGAPLDGSIDTYPFMNTGCVRKANYRDSFYPQYVNMKPDAYMARYTGADNGGYDMNSRYAGTDGRASYSGDRGAYDGNRGSY